MSAEKLWPVHHSFIVMSERVSQGHRFAIRARPIERRKTRPCLAWALGKHLNSMAADGTVDYTYDALDRLITKATPEGTLSYTYDAAGHVESIVSSNTNVVSVSYSYDDLNR
jgi:YD repeat-containing protein